jgi:hypothetical protein
MVPNHCNSPKVTVASGTTLRLLPVAQNFYNDNMDCYVTLTLASGGTIALVFSFFRTEANSDYLSLFNGTSQSQSLVARWSGFRSPNDVVVSYSPTMTVWFRSDGSVTDQGFSALICDFADLNDADFDGFSICAGDCDDTNSAVNPNALEEQDGIDNDCNGRVDACPPGMRLTDDGDCTPCPQGTFCDGLDTRTPSLCPTGRYNNVFGQALCPACPPGRFSAFIGQTQCSDCNPGARCPSGGVSAEGLVCPVGKWAPLTGSVCQPCTAGRWGSARQQYTGACEGQCAGGRFSVPDGPLLLDLTEATIAFHRGSILCSGQCPAGFACSPGTVSDDYFATTAGVPCLRALGVYSNAGAAYCSVLTDRLLLEELYAAMRGQTWLRSDNWLTGSPCDPSAPWFGVACASVGGTLRVTYVDRRAVFWGVDAWRGAARSAPS